MCFISSFFTGFKWLNRLELLGIILKTSSRPISEEEKQRGIKSIIKHPSSKEVQLKEKIYSYDGVFTQANSQYDVYSMVVGPMIHDVIRGYNCTVFAYGQTGSGKTYTMTGGHISHMCSPTNSPNLNWREVSVFLVN